MCRLNHRQKIDSGRVTRLITKNAVRAAVGVHGRPVPERPVPAQPVADHHADEAGDDERQDRLVPEPRVAGQVEAVGQEVEHREGHERRQAPGDHEAPDLDEQMRQARHPSSLEKRLPDRGTSGRGSAATSRRRRQGPPPGCWRGEREAEPCAGVDRSDPHAVSTASRTVALRTAPICAASPPPHTCDAQHPPEVAGRPQSASRAASSAATAGADVARTRVSGAARTRKTGRTHTTAQRTKAGE